MTAPLIGITSSRAPNAEGNLLHTVAEAYVQAVLSAGGTPLLIPLGLPAQALAALPAHLDGILFSGGGDVHPRHYGAEGNPLVKSIDADRDRVELQLARQAVDRGLPFLGICRGIQLINIALGGLLYADIQESCPEALRHDTVPGRPRDFLAHPVEVMPGSRLAGILGESSLQVNSLHHQGLKRLAPGLQAVAHAPDGLIEAIELPGHPFGLAVQWHPEWLQSHPPMRRLFSAFVAASGNGGSGQA